MNNDLRGLNLRKKKKNIDSPEEFFQDSIYNAQTKWGELVKYKELAHCIGPRASLIHVDLNQASLIGTDFTQSRFEEVSLE